jgi:LysM repeat protein
VKLDSLIFKVSQGMDILSRNRINVPQEENNASDTLAQIDSVVPVPLVIAPRAPRHQNGEVIHVVKHGETLYRIALHYHVPVAAIAKKNKLNMRKKLKYGIKLKIPVTLQ